MYALAGFRASLMINCSVAATINIDIFISGLSRALVCRAHSQYLVRRICVLAVLLTFYRPSCPSGPTQLTVWHADQLLQHTLSRNLGRGACLGGRCAWVHPVNFSIQHLSSQH